MVRIVVVAALSVAATATASAPARPACHPIGPHVLARGNLDADRAPETLAELEGPVDCAHSAFVAEMRIGDVCRGVARTYLVSGTYRRPDERLDRGEIIEADGRRLRQEAFFVVRGGTAGTGEAAVVELVPPRARACPRPTFLFRYRPALNVDAFSVTLSDRTRRFRGLEVRVQEQIGVDVFVRTYRFDRARGRYVGYGSR